MTDTEMSIFLREAPAELETEKLHLRETKMKQMFLNEGQKRGERNEKNPLPSVIRGVSVISHRW